MSNDKPKPAKAASQQTADAKGAKPSKAVPKSGAASPPPAGPRPPLFRKIDWFTFGATTLIILIGYLFTLSPDLTLEDSGELATGSFYAGVPHAPGYPVWTMYSWLFTVIIPFGNVAFRVSISSAVAGSLACGLLGLLVSRGSSMILEGIEELKDLEQRWENALCVVSGFVAALVLGFNGFLWSQSVIVEVYTLSCLSFLGVLCCLVRWIYAPEQHRYLYWSFFLFGISFNNHQTLIVAAMGLEVAIAAAQPKLGRDLFLGNVMVWATGLILKGAGVFTFFDANVPLYVIYNTVGLGSLAACIWLTIQTKSILTEWKIVLVMLVAWIIGASFYFFMPLTSSTNPPMNWAYPRTWDGFIHAFSRGQYEKTNPTDILGDPWHFVLQLKMYFEGAIEEFNLSYLLVAVVPFCFLGRMQRRERAWIIGNTAIYACLAFLLLILLNPNTDKQSRDLTKVFFTASHLVIGMFMGYGLTLIGAMLLKYYERFRLAALIGGAVAVAVALYALVARLQDVYLDPKTGMTGLTLIFKGISRAFANGSSTPPIYTIYAALYVLALTLVFTVAILLNRERVRASFLIGIFAMMPFYSVLSHWADNEQRGHLFGFWFGHDMFTPPFGVYPEMTKNAVLFGGTDPGRFCPTYMIFCESFIKPKDRRDPKFDRRDVYIITQNALADGTYLSYIRAHYNRSSMEDPPFLRDFVLWLQNMALGQQERDRKARGETCHTNAIAKAIGSLTHLVAPFDNVVLSVGKKVEERRRREGVYPPVEILTPTVDDSQKAFQEYIYDAQRRLLHDQQNPNEPKQIHPGELVSFSPDGRVQVAGQVAVMAINGLLTKVIFDKNPTNEFFVEESFPLDWMYPYLSPFGIIMKINRNPVPEFTEAILRKDHEFWSRYSERLCGDWITYDTPVKDICAFVDRIYRRGDLTGYKGDVKFIRDNDAQKAFSKLRNSIAGLYSWRISDARTNPTERARVIKEADFAFKQAFAFCPYSPETVTRYVQLLAGIGRLDDALAVAETCKSFDEDSPFTQNLVDQISQMRDRMGTLSQMQNQIGQYEQQYRANSNNPKAAFDLVSVYLQLQRSNQAFQILQDLIARTNVDAGTLLSVANAFLQLGQFDKVEPTLQRLVAVAPDNAEVWYDLAGTQSALGKRQAALQSLMTAVRLSDQRLLVDPKASNLHAMAVTDARFLPLHAMPEFQKAFGSTTPRLEAPLK